MGEAEEVARSSLDSSISMVTPITSFDLLKALAARLLQLLLAAAAAAAAAAAPLTPGGGRAAAIL